MGVFKELWREEAWCGGGKAKYRWLGFEFQTKEMCEEEWGRVIERSEENGNVKKGQGEFDNMRVGLQKVSRFIKKYI